MATEKTKLDEELGRILKLAAEMTLNPSELHPQQAQSSTWPWQVQQAPSYISDHTPVRSGN